MSDEQDNSGSESSGSGMTSRLASLRASIRASKEARDAAETQEQVSPGVPATAVTSPTAISSSQTLPIPPPPEDDEYDEYDDDFIADDTQISLSSDELRPPDEETDEPPRRPFRESGEHFTTDNLHRVRPSQEAPLSADGSSEMLSQMDQLSEAADQSADSGFGDPTMIQSAEDLAFVQGTPLYMSPEQCRNERPDPSTDVYSLGVMMFELLEGKPPYVAETVEEVLLMHQDAPIPQQTSKFTPPEVKILLARMLAKRPENRPSVAEVIDVLQRHVTIGGPDVFGLEEESWSVSDVEESEPLPAPIHLAPPPVGDPFASQQTAPPLGGAQTDASSDRKLPIWLLLLGAVLFVGSVAAVAVTLVSSDGEDTTLPDPTPPPMVVADEPTTEPEVVADPAPDPEPEPDPQPDPAEEMQFGAAEADAGNAADAGSAKDAGRSDEPVVEEAPEPPKKKKRRKRRKRRRKPKKEELRELRLEL